MCLKKYGLLTFLFFCCLLYAEKGVSVNRVDRIQELLSTPQKNTVDKEGMLYGKKVIKKENEDGVYYLGLRLFPEDMRKQLPLLISEFLESYLLELALLPNRTMMYAELKSNRIDLSLENVKLAKREYMIADLLVLITDQSAFRLQVEASAYMAEWTTAQDGKIRFTFPKRYELIFGKDKKTMEEEFISQLKTWILPESRAVVDKQQLRGSAHSDILYLPGSYYHLPGVNNNTYFESNGGTYSYVFSDRHIAESISNLFTSADYMNLHIPVHIVQRMYGNSRRKLDTDISILLSFMRGQGCEVFTGIEACENGVVSGSIFFVNKDLGYNHLMYYEMPVNVLRKTDIPVSAVFYAYVPTHNISQLFGVHTTTGAPKELDIVE